MLKKIKLHHILQLAVIFVVGYGVGHFLQRDAVKQVEVQAQQIINLESELSSIRKIKAQASVDLQTTSVQLASIQEQQRALFNENAELKKDLTFYQRIMAPEKVINGVMLDSLLIADEVSDGYYYLEVVLVQVQRKKRHIKAQGELIISGSLAGKPIEYSWTQLRDDKTEKLAFSFRYFQKIEARLKLPEGFIPERINFAADVKGNRWNSGSKLTESYEWEGVLQSNSALELQ